jgi:hypothetical protein
MDQDAMVSAVLDGGQYLIDVLRDSGFNIEVAFWAKPSEERWRLFLASPVVDEKGARAVFSIIHDAIRAAPECGIDPSEVRAIGIENPMAKEAAEAVKPKVAVGPSAVRKRKPYTGVTRYLGSTLGGISVDGAFVYPQPQPASTP